MNYFRFSLNSENKEMANASYLLFKEVWEPLSRELDFNLNYDDFLRADVCHLLTENHKPAALTFTTIFDLELEASFDHSYIRKFPKDFLRHLLELKGSKIGAFEYLTTKKCSYRKELAQIILALAFKSIDDLNFDRAICLTRDDVSINEMVRKLGFYTFHEEGTANGLPTSYHMTTAYKQIDNITIANRVNEIWINRIDSIGEKYYAEYRNKNYIKQFEQAS